MKAYICVNGSNDLCEIFTEGVQKLLKSYGVVEDIEIFLAYSLGDIYTVEDRVDIGCYLFKNGSIEKIKCDFKSENTNLNIYSFLNLVFDKNYKGKNILILSGHGGPFQAYLDMGVSPAKSINTFGLCKIIKMYKFDLVFLDMCAMNYVEVIYELLSSDNIQNILTYKSLAPYRCIDFIKFIEEIKSGRYRKLLEWDEEFIFFEKDSLLLIEHFIKRIDNLYYDVLSHRVDINKAISNIEKMLDIVGEYKAVNSINRSLNFIKFNLCDKNDIGVYEQFLFSNNCLWANLVTKAKSGIYKDYIVLAEESIKNIIASHNTSFTIKQIENEFKLYLKMRNEESYYI